jgi:hypothetical protein
LWLQAMSAAIKIQLPLPGFIESFCFVACLN